MTTSLSPSPISDLLGFAAGQGHRDYPCLSREHAPASCVPCADFSPWLRDPVRRGDVQAVAEYLFRVREANPGPGESREQLRGRYGRLASALLGARLERHLTGGDEVAYLELRVALVLLAAHEGFSGFIMTGEAADFVAGIMAPHDVALRDAGGLVEARNRFVREMGREMSYWAAWPLLAADGLPPLPPPYDPLLRDLLDALQALPLGARAHATDAICHLSAHSQVPKTLASLCRYETRKRGLDVAKSSRLILASGVVMPATDLDAWLGTWTRRELLGFLVQSGVGARNAWGKQRLAEVAKLECGERLRARMAAAGVVQLAPPHVHGARLLRRHVEAARESWRVWLAFGTGIELRN